MREIKFRAYDKDNKVMHKVFKIDFLREYVYLDKDTTYIFKQVELMQFTGLKDKNGKEICEKDIIETMAGRVSGRGPIQVRFEDGGFFPFAKWSGLGVANFQCEVIGNIYENPELIQEPSPPIT